MEVVSTVKSNLTSRYLWAVFSATLWQLALYAVIDGLLFADFWNPIYWFFSAKLIKAFAPATVLMLMIGYFKLQLLTSTQPVPHTRYQVFKRRFSWRVLLNLVLFAALSASIPWGFSRLNRMSIFRQCHERRDRVCIDRHNLFVILCACWSGIFYACEECLTSLSQTRYPVIHQNLFMKQRNKFMETVKESLPYTMLYVLYFFPVFYMCCSAVVEMIKYFVVVYAEDAPLLSLKLIFQAWVLSAVVYSSLKLFIISLDLYLTQNMNFPVNQMISLLDKTNSRFYIELVLQDLYLLAHSRGTLEVAEIFALGQPGGVPGVPVWEGLLRHCLAIISQFNWDLGLYAKDTPEEKKDSTAEATRRFPMTMRRLQDYHELSSPNGSSLRGRPVPEEHTENVQRYPEHKLQMLVESCKNSKFYKYFFDVDADLRETCILENSQMVVWAVGALSVLASRALTEDRFGVVVNDLPMIVTELLNIRTTVHIAKRKHKNSERANRMRIAIRDVTSRGLFRISRTYSDYLDVLPLPQGALASLRAYMNGTRH